MIRVPVLVVGAGSVGLTTTLLLAEHGVTAMAVDRREGPSPHPRATGLNERTWEILRAAGLQDRLSAELSTRPRNGGVVSVSGPLPPPTSTRRTGPRIVPELLDTGPR